VTGPLRDFLDTFPGNVLRCFRGRNLPWHAVAIGATYLIVRSDFDWAYRQATRPYAGYLFPAVLAGWLVPVAYPVASYLFGAIRGNRRAVYCAFAAAQAAVIGLLISGLYKAFTGRPGPGHHALGALTDISKVFRFGFLRGGVFYGWPSTHATVAFAIAGAVWALYPRGRAMRVLALAFGIYVGVGVSMTIHWLSDAVAGAILGTVIGFTVGHVFEELLRRETS
jgi:membrane-associated phospholipid phosphatase